MATGIRTAGGDDKAGVIGVMTLAFSTDPMARWSFPDAGNYLASFPRLAEAFGGSALAAGTAYVADGYSGAALWLSPGTHPDEQAMVDLIETSAPASIKPDIYGVFELMDKFHPKGPHWYLPMIGVDPSKQGDGVGSSLMEHALEVCDRDHLIAYLESSNPRNISLYERHGFEVIGEIQSGSSPVLRPMLRKAR